MTELISCSHDRPLTMSERVRLRLHTLTCGACRRYQRQLATISALLRRSATTIGFGPIGTEDEARAERRADEGLSPDAAARIRDVIRTEQ